MGELRHFPGFHVRMVVEYVEHRLGAPGVEELLDRAGIDRPMPELLDDASWYSYDEFRRVLEAAAAVLGGREELLHITETADTAGGNMPEVTGMLQAFGSPSAMFASMANGDSGVSTITVGHTEQVGPAEWLLHTALIEGFEPFPELCVFIRAISGVGVRLFGLKPTGNDELACQCNGDECCTIRLTWDESEDLGNQLDYTRTALKLAHSSLESFQELVGELVSTEDLDTVLERIMAMSSRAMRAPSFVLALEPLPWTTRRVYWAGSTQEDATAVAARVAGGDTSGTMVVDVTSARRHHGRLIAYGPHGSVSPNEVPVLQAYARIAATALDSACALEEARRQADTARALLGLSTSLADIASAGELAARLVRAMPAVIDCDCSAMVLVDEGGVARMAAHHDMPDTVIKALDAADYRVFDAPQGVILRTRQSERSRESSALMGMAGLEAMATAPVFIDGAPVGFLIAGVTNDASRLVDDPMLEERFGGLVGQAAVALRNGRLLDHIRHQSLHDALTELPNRALILDRAEQMLARSRRNRTACAAFFLDLDGFKEVNDTLGHGAGDELLRSVAARLATTVRANDTVGRLGGDEFVVLSDGLSLDAGPEVVAERILDVLRTPFVLPGRERPLVVTTSVGIAVGDRKTADDLLRDADIALYSAKAAGKNCYRIFADEMQAAVADRAELTTSLQQALARDEFSLVYQPIFDMPSESVTGVEALLRWHHPVRGTVGPDVFIPLLEESGLIIDVGRWVLHEACRQTAEWHAAGRHLKVSVNASVRQLERHDFVDDVRAALTSTGLEASSLIIEITETAIMRDAEATAAALKTLKELGVRIAIDDFGTGYSSLAYLRQFPVDSLKIDRTFIHAIADSPAAAELIHTLVSLGKALRLETLAEGIEHREQFDKLQSEGCDSGQGYMFARPMTPDALEAFLQERDPATQLADGSAGRWEPAAPLGGAVGG